MDGVSLVYEGSRHVLYQVFGRSCAHHHCHCVGLLALPHAHHHPLVVRHLYCNTYCSTTPAWDGMLSVGNESFAGGMASSHPSSCICSNWLQHTEPQKYSPSYAECPLPKVMSYYTNLADNSHQHTPHMQALKPIFISTQTPYCPHLTKQ